MTTAIGEPTTTNDFAPTSEELSRAHAQIGAATIKIISDYTQRLDKMRVSAAMTPDQLVKMFAEPLPRESVDANSILESFARDIIPHSQQIPSPRYFGQFNATPLPIAVWMDALISCINQNGAIWRNAPVVSVIETQVLRWLCELVGYDETSFGTLTSGGSEANLIALKCARDDRDEKIIAHGLSQTKNEQGNLIVYASEQCHYSFEKSVDILGLGRENLRKVAVDEKFHIRLDLLREAIKRDLTDGNTPLAIVAACGATSTGIIDPLDSLADIAEEFDLWFHVDGAYGGALIFSEKYRHTLLHGIERADSLTIDPHKWLFVPFECGAILMRGQDGKDGKRVLRDSFDSSPAYLQKDMNGAEVEFDFFRYGQLGSRRGMALKLWAAWKFLGVGGYAKILERQIELTKYLSARLDELETFTRVGEVETAVCCFQFAPPRLPEVLKDGIKFDTLQIELQQRIERSGEAWFASTVLNGRRALRVNINIFLTERRHVDDLVDLLKCESEKMLSERV
ncbi:MAG: pyridoxal-dependent decarboxylase [Pyrinomonadaceae bacterium]